MTNWKASTLPSERVYYLDHLRYYVTVGFYNLVLVTLLFAGIAELTILLKLIQYIWFS